MDSGISLLSAAFVYCEAQFFTGLVDCSFSSNHGEKECLFMIVVR
jgi:hypothetical protein